jgi:N-acetylglucosaminyl-diphospho-decaprenol L-rhamnosyltransferase
VRAYDLTGHSERVGDTLDLAVVIVNYETGAWLERCLRSLEGARGDVSVEVVVIDNASGDGSADVSEALGARLIRNDTNRYLSPAWNQGAAVTQTPYLLFLNPDTEWFHGTLADLLGAARRHPRAGIVGPMLRNPDGTVYPSGRRFPSLVDAIGHAFLSPFTRNNPFTRRYEMDRWDRSTEREVDWVSGAAMLIPREAFDAVGGFDEGFPLYGEELDIATRLRALDRSALFTPAAEVIHAVGVSTGGDRRPHRLVVMHSQSLYRYYAKHRAPGWRRATLPAAWLALRARAELAWLTGRFRG